MRKLSDGGEEEKRRRGYKKEESREGHDMTHEKWSWTGDPVRETLN